MISEKRPRARLLAVAATVGLPALLGGMHAAQADTPLPLCSGSKEVMAKNVAMNDAVAAVFGRDARFATDDPSLNSVPPCTKIEALLHFQNADVLVTSVATGQGASDSASLSAATLRKSDAGYRVVSRNPNFGEGIGKWGNAGNISGTHITGDDAIAVTGSEGDQGYSNSWEALYALRQGGIVSLGSVPTGWDNGGAESDPAKEVTISSKFVESPQPDEIHMTYIRDSNGKSQTSAAVWRSVKGKYLLASGAVPEEITKNFNFDRMPDAVSAQTGATSSIEDADLATLPGSVDGAVQRDRSFPDTCKLIGKPIQLSASQSLQTYFVTTANRCGWDTSTGPIWIVTKDQNDQTQLVLGTQGHSVKLSGTVENGFLDLSVNSGSPIDDTPDVYGYDGQAYRRKSS